MTEERESPRTERWSGFVLAMLMLSAFLLVGQRIYVVATGPLPPRAGEAAPSFEGVSVTAPDRKQRLDALSGKVVLIDFWATWCPPCVASMPELEQLHQELGDRGVVVLGVNQEPDDLEDVRKFLKQRRITFPSLVDDGSIAAAYGVYSFPSSFLVGGDGIIRQAYRGPTSAVRLRRDIEQVLAEPIPTSTTGQRKAP